MSVQLRDVVNAKHLRLRTLFSFDRCLDREVSWTYTTDLLDPTRYLTQNQLLLTGLMWRRKPADSETFIRNIAQVNPVALLAGEGLLGYVPDDVIVACERHSIPLFAVSHDVSFASITAFISNTIASRRIDRLSSGLQRQRERLLDVYRGQMLEEMIVRSSHELGRPLWVVSSTGRRIAQSNEPMEQAHLSHVLEHVLASEVTPTTVTGPGTDTLSVLTIRTLGEHRATSWFLIVPGNWDSWDPAILDSIQDLASVIGIYRAQRNAEVFAGGGIGGRLIELLHTQQEHPEIPMYLKQCGISETSAGIVVVASFVGRPDLRDLASWLLHEASAEYSKAIVGNNEEGQTVAFIGSISNEDRQNPADELIASIRRAERGFASDGTLSLGVSRPITAEHASGALRSARFSLQSISPSDSNSAPVQVQYSSDVNTAFHLMSMVPDQQRRMFADGILGPVIDQDSRGHNDLIVTLRTFLDCDCSWVQTAELMHVHLNTVRYRIRRVEELTGKNLSRTADRADVYLALSVL